MASSEAPEREPPRKRQRLSPPPPPPSTTSTTQQPAKNVDKMEDQRTQVVVSDNGFQPERETEVGILRFVNTSNPGFSGTLKQRYTDFIVNEITPEGSVVHLTDDRAPIFKAASRDGVGNASKTSTGNRNPPPTEPAKPLKANETVDAEAPPDKSVKLDDKIESEAPSALPEETKPQDTTLSTSAEEPRNDISKQAFTLTTEDEKLLASYFGESLKNDIIKFHEKVLSKPDAKAGVFGSLLSEPFTDRALRGRLHQDIRRIFDSRLETESVEDGRIKITAAPKATARPRGDPAASNSRPRNQGQPKGKLGWQELGGQYLHFSLYKENKDTMEVISYLCKMLKVKPKDFAFAGTKDRRAVTVQRVSVWHQYAHVLAKLNNTLRSSRVGNFKHEKHRLELGELHGNQFHITLRDCHFGDDADLEDDARLKLANEIVSQAVEHLQGHGFINYFGLQRFGTFGIGTDAVGKMILKENFEGAVNAILDYSEESLVASWNENDWANSKIGRDDIARAQAIHLWETTGKGQEALDKLPRKFSAEYQIIRHLSSHGRNTDFLGALLMINRNLRTMYVHAYQSLVWNLAASERWTRYGDKVIEGDLVIVENQTTKAAADKDEVDENGEIIVRPAGDDAAITSDDIYERARPLSADEASSGKYTIFDIVLPTPGFDIEYPANDIGDYYKEFMQSKRGGGLDPADMRRKQKDFSLSGSYRKLLAKVGDDMSFEVRAYHEENEQLVETDLEKIMKSRPQRENNSNSQNGRFDNGPRGSENGRSDSRQTARGRGFGQNRGGRHNNDFYNRSSGGGYAAGGSYNADPRQTAPRDQALPGNSAALSAWQNLPTKLAADDKARVEAEELRKLTEPPVDPDTIVQPIYQETFIQTSADGSGRTGYRSTQLISYDGVVEDLPKEDTAKPVNTPAAEVPTTSTAMDIDSQPAATDTSTAAPDSVSTKLVKEEAKTDTFNTSFGFTDSLDDPQDGGVKLTVEESPLNRPAEEISAVSAAESTTLEENMAASTEDASNDTAAAAEANVEEEPKPLRIAVIVKFALGASQYATMALRELMKAGGVKTYKPDFSSGR